jgi:divalent metal cation (Fe/Co/Zn/Cd) transporter
MGAQILIGLICLAVMLFLFFASWVIFFRLSCRLCKMDPPGVLQTIGIVILTLIASFIVDGILAWIVRAVYIRSNMPIWESGIATFFLGLPVDMLINAGIHAKVMDISMGRGIEVWFVQRVLLMLVFGIIGVCVGGILLAVN